MFHRLVYGVLAIPVDFISYALAGISDVSVRAMQLRELCGCALANAVGRTPTLL
jgi:hypothetical protein